jgi:hypothetical protein
MRTARRLAVEFDQRLGTHADEFIAFEAPGRAIAIGITMPPALLRTEDAVRLGWIPPAADDAPAKSGRFDPVPGADRLREVVTIERKIVLGGTSCLNLVQLLRRESGESYAVHGVASTSAESALRADMAAVVARITTC